MKKTTSLFLLATAMFAGSAYAQEKCATDIVHRQYIKENPKMAESEKQFNDAIRRTLAGLDTRTLNKTTIGADTIIDIPVVVHIQHSYATSDYLTDESVYNLIKRMNNTYSLNYDTSSVIAPFKKYVGKANIRFHLATKDPLGQPTTGITRRFTYLTFGKDDFAKIDQWSPSNYYNIWFENVIGRGVAGGTVLAYAQFPSDYDYRPYYDGVICRADALGDGSTLEHETGHYLSLYHVWNSSGAAAGTAGACGDDEVDDTPPTIGHFGGCILYDTACAINYFKIYPVIDSYVHNSTGAVIDSVMRDSLANYPDTANAQNIMDYSDCELMFTKGQVVRMRAALGSDVGHRRFLCSDTNLALTGALDSRPDLTPIPDFFASNQSLPGNLRVQYFTCPGTDLRFTNKTWRDTVTSLTWSFDKGASTPTSTVTNPTFSTFINNHFSEQGWVSVKMVATGNHSGTDSVTINNRIYVANPTATPAAGPVEEFNNVDGDFNQWPTFNYFNNEFKWQHASVGLWDGHSMMYTGYDSRVNPSMGIYPVYGTPQGDFDDFFSIPYDLTSFASGNCNMNFYTSAASRSSNSLDINDTMVISYSTDGAKTWTTLATLAKSDLINKGALSIPYAPLSPDDWKPRTYNIPTTARQSYVVFRFRYKPGVDHNGYQISTGNNFYMDRLHFSQYAAGVEDVHTNGADVVVVPNPTNSNAFVVVKDADNTTAKIVVSDVTGKVVYTASQAIVNGDARIEIPQSAISVKGLYLVQAITGNQTKTQKLVVY